MRRPKNHRPAFGLNMTPMIDVVFQLLIFFVCTVEFQKREEMLEANLPPLGQGPKAAVRTPQELDLGRIEVTVTSDRISAAFLGRTRELTRPEQDDSLEQLTQQLREWTRIDPQIPARIHCRPDVPTGTLLQVYDACLRAGLTDVRLSDRLANER